MANDAKVSFVGTVISDPKQNQVNNSTVLNLVVAVQTTKKQPNSQYSANDLYRVSVWGKYAESLIDKIKIKTRIWVTGSQMLDPIWKDRDGNDHQSISVLSQDIKILSNGTWNRKNDNTPQPTNEEVVTSVEEEEVPF